MKIFVKNTAQIKIEFKVNIIPIDREQSMNEWKYQWKIMFISCGTLQCLFVYINDELQTTVVTVLLCCLNIFPETYAAISI